MAPLWQLTFARFKEFYREPAAVFWVYGFPLMLALALGIAFRDRPVEQVRIDIRNDGPGGAAAAERMRAQLAADPRIKIEIGDEDETRNRLRVAKTDLVVIPAATVSEPDDYLLDPNRPDCTLAKSVVESAILRQRMPSTLTPHEQSIEEPGGRYIDFLIPGLLGTNLMGGGLFGVGFVTVDMRVRKLLKRFAATPMRRSDFLLSLVLSRLIFTLIEIAILITFAHLIFDIRIRGDFSAFLVLMLAGGACFGGIGLLIASRARTLETASGLMNLVMLPMYVVSGVFFSSERFPAVVQPAIKVLPLTALNDGLRAVMNDGAGWGALPYPLLILAIWGALSFVLALKLFRWK